MGIYAGLLSGPLFKKANYFQKQLFQHLGTLGFPGGRQSAPKPWKDQLFKRTHYLKNNYSRERPVHVQRVRFLPPATLRDEPSCANGNAGVLPSKHVHLLPSHYAQRS